VKPTGVFVRGVGAWTPLGSDWPSSFERLCEGESAIAPIESFDVEGFPTRVGACITQCRSPNEDPRVVLAVRAAREAWSRAEIAVQPGRIGIFVGAEAGRPVFSAAAELAAACTEGDSFDQGRFARAGLRRWREVRAGWDSPAAVASRLASELGATGPVQTVSLACASGAMAIVAAVRALREGVCDAALCGGVGADVDPFTLAGFGLLGALSARGVARPFDARRDGFVLGEGAAMMVLARERGDSSVEVCGLGCSSDAYHLTAPEPSGAAARRAMSTAMREAGVDRLDCVQAHGTSTLLNDAVEAASLREVLGSNCPSTYVSSVKGALGHPIAAAGAIGFACAAQAVASGIIVPTAGLTSIDPDCALRHVTGQAVHQTVESAMVNSLAFGGANCSIVLRRCS